MSFLHSEFVSENIELLSWKRWRKPNFYREQFLTAICPGYDFKHASKNKGDEEQVEKPPHIEPERREERGSIETVDPRF